MISPVVTMKTLEWFTGIVRCVTFVIVFNYQKYYHKFLCLSNGTVKPLPLGGGYKANTLNVAIHILAAGQVVSACGVGRAQALTLKQEPAYGMTH